MGFIPGHGGGFVLKVKRTFVVVVTCCLYLFVRRCCCCGVVVVGDRLLSTRNTQIGRNISQPAQLMNLKNYF